MSKSKVHLVLIFSALLFPVIRAQSPAGIEFQLEGGMAKGTNDKVFSYNFQFATGYYLSERFALAAGVGFNNYDNHTGLPNATAGKPDFETGWHSSWRPYLQAKYNISSHRRINPFVRLNVGWAFFSSRKKEFSYADETGEGYTSTPFTIRGGISPSLDVGIWRSLPKGKAKLYASAYYLYQPVTYRYMSTNVGRKISTAGVNLGVMF